MFLETQFPTKLALMSVGGPGYNTSVNLGFSGYEQRNKNWSAPRYQYTVSFEHKPQAELDALTAMFHAAGGMANAFRLFDHADYIGTGQLIGTGDGLTQTFQLQKSYTGAGQTYIRPVQKPITSRVTDFEGNALTDTVTVYLNGVAQTTSSGYNVLDTKQYKMDETSGVVTFFGAGKLTITAVAVSGTSATYAYTLSAGKNPVTSQKVVISGLNNSVNNGTFTVTSVGTGTFTVTNASATTATGNNGTGLVYISKLSITAVTHSGANTIYSYNISDGASLVTGMRVYISGMSDSGNNGTFYIASLGAGTFTVANASGVTNGSTTGTGLTDWIPASGKTITADYHFHVPVRFDIDQMQRQIERQVAAGGLYTVTGIQLIEVRIVPGQSS